ncbi:MULTISPECIES: ABC transporter permease [Nocardiopsis]|uniref:Transport permease protein n=1 Tax=Nocardiopsis sinuspersici TaxID=501010 RepID=A0A1V3C6G8_9ACTN|nr:MULTISPECIES: ABC transporter permease [Nocardiopsis]NYH52969.1 ABC-2 type transport system permease protein [Nocardiopsis sinuspersici]OOC56367.1 ABC transporter permease [Nocardiopsis sinuspersici]
MNTLTHAVGDSATMVGRQFRHMVRYPSLTLMLAGQAIVLLLLFVYVFGGAMGTGAGAATSRADYLEYITPGIMMIAVASAALGTAISVATDMTEGIVARFRTMAIARVSVLTGHVVGSLFQALLCVALVTGVALLLGFRPTAGPGGWLAALGLVLMVSFALVWLSVALGLVSKTVESASNLPMPLVFLPFLSSGFVPTETLPTGLRWFAEYQPFTPVIETLRGLLMGTGTGGSGVAAVAWCAGVTLVSYLWARKLYNRDPAA